MVDNGVVKEFLRYRKPIGEQLKDTVYLLKHTFAIVGKNAAIIRPTYLMMAYSLVMTTLTSGAVVMVFAQWHTLIAVALLLVNFLILMPYRFLFFTRQKACQGWMTYQAISGQTTSYRQAQEQVKGMKGQFFLIALVDLLVAYAGSRRGQEPRGWTGILIGLFLSVLVEVWVTVHGNWLRQFPRTVYRRFADLSNA